jgi:hypothetical protein
MKTKTSIQTAARHFLYCLLACVLFISCSSQKINRDRLGKKPNIMYDQNGGMWIVSHHIGDLYRVEFVSDSLVLIAR